MGRLWISEWNAGNLSRYDPVSKRWKNYRLPGAQPYAYAVYVDEHDMVWVSDFGANAILRFDPNTETFQSFSSDRPGADVRQILGRPARYGEPNPAPTAWWLSAAVKKGR
jgi:virginiamycin B lyase